MIVYFIGQPPYLQDFWECLEEEFHLWNGWHINHTQYVGKNFFLIEFPDLEDQDIALATAP